MVHTHGTAASDAVSPSTSCPHNPQPYPINFTEGGLRWSANVTDRDMNMVHYPVFAEPFVLVVIRGALDMLQLIQPQVADIPLASCM